MSNKEYSTKYNRQPRNSGSLDQDSLLGATSLPPKILSNVFLFSNSIGSRSLGRLGGEGGRKKRCCCRCGSPKEPPTCTYKVELNQEYQHPQDFIVRKIEEYERQLHKLSTESSKVNGNLLKFHNALVQSFENCLLVISNLTKINGICTHVTEQLSYSTTPENAFSSWLPKMTKNRSRIGSYMWLVTRILKDSRQYVDGKPKDFEEIRQFLADIIGHSSIGWFSFTHMVNDYIQLRHSVNLILHKYIDVHDPNNVDKSFRKSLQDKRRDKVEQLKLYNRVGRNDQKEDAISEENLDLTCIRTIVVHKSTESYSHNKDAKTWDPIYTLPLKELIASINSLCAMSVDTFQKSQSYLQKIDGVIHKNNTNIQISPKDAVGEKRGFGSSGGKNISNLCIQDLLQMLTSNLKILWRHKNHYLKGEESEAIVTMGQILTSKLDLTEFIVMSLRGLLEEIRLAVHVSYEYCRYFYLTDLPKYERAMEAIVTKRCTCNISGQNDDYSDMETELSSLDTRTIIFLFKLSPYMQILQFIPVKLENRLLMLKCKDDTVELEAPLPSAISL